MMFFLGEDAEFAHKFGIFTSTRPSQSSNKDAQRSQDNIDIEEKLEAAGEQENSYSAIYQIALKKYQENEYRGYKPGFLSDKRHDRKNPPGRVTTLGVNLQTKTSDQAKKQVLKIFLTKKELFIPVASYNNTSFSLFLLDALVHYRPLEGWEIYYPDDKKTGHPEVYIFNYKIDNKITTLDIKELTQLAGSILAPYKGIHKKMINLTLELLSKQQTILSQLILLEALYFELVIQKSEAAAGLLKPFISWLRCLPYDRQNCPNEGYLSTCNSPGYENTRWKNEFNMQELPNIVGIYEQIRSNLQETQEIRKEKPDNKKEMEERPTSIIGLICFTKNELVTLVDSTSHRVSRERDAKGDLSKPM